MCFMKWGWEYAGRHLDTARRTCDDIHDCRLRETIRFTVLLFRLHQMASAGLVQTFYWRDGDVRRIAPCHWHLVCHIRPVRRCPITLGLHRGNPCPSTGQGQLGGYDTHSAARPTIKPPDPIIALIGKGIALPSSKKEKQPATSCVLTGCHTAAAPINTLVFSG